MAILADSTKNVLFPKPLFTAYETMIATVGAEIRYYDLLPERNWEVDLQSLESHIDENTALIMLNK
jgi:tyrosine aminotransferase